MIVFNVSCLVELTIGRLTTLMLWCLYIHIGVPNIAKGGNFHGPFDVTAPFPYFYTLLEVVFNVYLLHACRYISFLAPIKYSH